MPFYTADTIKAMRALNSSGPRSDSQPIPAHRGPVANNSFDSLGPEPSSPASYTNPRIPLRSHTGSESSVEEDTDVGSRTDRGRGSSAGMTRNLPQERSRFVSVQRWSERATNASVSQILAVHPRQPSAGQSRVPAPIKATPATVSRVFGPRPFRSQRVFHARREPTLAVPKAVRPLPEWLTDFEDGDKEPSQFCPPSEGSSPSTSTLLTTTGIKLHSNRVFKRPPPGMAPPLGSSRLGYADTGIEADECSDEDGGCDPFEFDTDSDFELDYASFRSESSTPERYCAVDASDRPTPYRGQIADEEGTPLDFLPRGSPTFPPSGLHAPSSATSNLGVTKLPDTIHFPGAPIIPSPLQSSVASASTYYITGNALVEARTDRFLTEMEEGLGFISRPASGSTLDSFEDEGVELDAIIISPRSPVL